MLSNSPSRKALGFSFLLTALLAGCREDPAPKPETRATQVPPKQDKPAPDKPAPPVPAATTVAVPSTLKPAADVASTVPSAIAAPSASAAAAPVPDPPLDCDKLLSLDDVFAACKIKVEAPADQPTEDIGTEGRCVRRFSSKEAGLLTLIVVRHASDAEAKERYYNDFKVELSKPDVVADAGDLARFFLKKGVSGDPILTAEAVKGRFNVTLFNPKVTVGGQTVGPVCEEKPLGKLLVQALSHIP